jgi:ribosomal protein S18 acetylase RimI-like enzyme
MIRYAIETPKASETAELFDASDLNWPRDLDVLTLMLSRAQFIAVAREENNLLVGLIRILTDDEFNAFIADLAVRPTYQLQGIGRNLVRLATEQRPRLKFVVTPTQHSIGFWTKCGFIDIQAVQRPRES